MNILNGQQQAQPQGQPQPVDGRQVPVVLDVDIWQNLLNLLSDAPWKAANPLILEVTKQINAELERRRSRGQESSQLHPGVTP